MNTFRKVMVWVLVIIFALSLIGTLGGEPEYLAAGLASTAFWGVLLAIVGYFEYKHHKEQANKKDKQ